MRRVIGILSVCCSLLLTGCRPDGILSDDRMVDVLYDLHRAEAILQLSDYGYGHDDAVAKYNHEVLARHGVTQAQFDSSVVWYTQNPITYSHIYPRVMARIDRELEAQERYRKAHIPESERPRNILPPFEQTVLLYHHYE